MSATDSDSETTSSTEFTHTSESLLQYTVTHVCLPVKLPVENDYTLKKDLSLARAVSTAAHAYSANLCGDSEPRWDCVAGMLDNLQASLQSEYLDSDLVISQLSGMRTGDILAFLIRHHNSAVIITKQEDNALFESFDLSPSNDATREATGSAVRSYPEFAVEIPNELLDSGYFRFELADYLSRPNTLNDYVSQPTHARYMTTLFSSVLRGAGRNVDIPHIVKRVYGDIYQTSMPAWRRSPVWLLVRVAIRMSLDRSLGYKSYKAFMLFFICTLASDENIPALSIDLLHSIASKITRRLGKHGLTIPDWLSQLALKACAGLRETLDTRWMRLGTRTSPFRNPSQDELTNDTQLSLEHSSNYIRNALADHPHEPVDIAFHPSHRRRGTIDDFLSSNGSFFDKAYDTDPEVTLYDVEQSIEQGIDDWVARVTNVDEACTQLEILMDKYVKRARCLDPEGKSIILLTGIELFVALDKLVVEKIPMLADYSPEIPVAWLERLLLRKTTHLHRLACVYQYLSARYSRSRSAGSVLSDEFTEDSFPVRYYDQSPHHQQLKRRIEEDGMVKGSGQQNSHHPFLRVQISQPPLPSSPLFAKVVVFELQCPASIRIWRSAAARIWHSACNLNAFFQDTPKETENILLAGSSTLQRYLVDRDGPPLEVQIHFSYFQTGAFPFDRLPLCYIVRYPNWDDGKHHLSSWWPPRHTLSGFSYPLLFRQYEYVNGTSHTSNTILAAQSSCPTDLSLDEFITLGQLRSGGLLQWGNILRGLRSRSLNLRRDYFNFLLSQAVFQVGPLDLSTGAWTWHQDLHEPSFCRALLSELKSLLMEAGSGSIDGMMMAIISLLLTRVLASSPSEGVSEQVIALLRRVRRKTFSWVQELLYNLIMAPTNEKRSGFLWEMAATCRGTFDVDQATLGKLYDSAEDVDALISCALFIHTLPSSRTNTDYGRLLSRRDRRLSLALEGTLGDVIIADVSDYGIDLAVAKTFTVHQPGAHRWEQLHYPDSRWFTCKIEATGDQPLQIVHLNLLNGELRTDGQRVVVLPRAITLNSIHQHIFRDQGFFVTPSTLPGMDFTTLSVTSKCKVHWAGRDDSLVIRAQSNESRDIFELIPSVKLEQDLPPALVDDCVHWLNLSKEIIEIRPLKWLWEESADSWRIDCTSGHYRACKGRETLVDIRSPTWKMVSECFKCLNSVCEKWTNHLLVTTSMIKSLHSTPLLQLAATLSRYELSFFVNTQGEFESYDFKDMVYDDNQCIGTLPGLDNILVLRQKAHLAEGLISRRVLIPSGFLGKHGDHQVQVMHNFYQSIEPLYYIYSVDLELGCLVGNGDLASTAYLAHLHAATSCDWPDPLTGKTGAQAALRLFRSAGCRSIMKFKALDISAVWASSRYPEIKDALLELQQRYYWSIPKTWQSASKDLEDQAQSKVLGYLSWLASGSSSSAELVPEEPGLSLHIGLDHLLSGRQAPQLPARSTLRHDNLKATSDNTPELNKIFSSFPMNKPGLPFQQEYIALLENSAQYLRADSRMAHSLARKHDTDALEKHYAHCRVRYMDALTALKQSLGPRTDSYEQSLHQLGRWPPVTADMLLRYLASTSPFKLPREWKKCLISLALLLLDIQRARRLLLFALDGNMKELSKELENDGCNGWDPEEFPDWLLIQIQGNFLIRRAQAETAMEMMSPQSSENTVMQVNMGEGKSSVIIPIIAAALADGKQLVRIIVPKALTAQMFELLVSRLGGLTNRPIYHLPFSRSPEHNDKDGGVSLRIDDLQKIMSRCMAERGIILVQPEHVVSLKLKTVEEQIQKNRLAASSLPKMQAWVYKHIEIALVRKQLSTDSLVGTLFRSLSQRPKKDIPGAESYDKRDESAYGRSDSASKWLNLQKWIHSHARDILDESDEVLRPRFQLIYTMGDQKHMDGYPDRWTITQQVLRLVKECAETLSRNHPDSIEYQRGPPGSFPHVHIVRASNIGRRIIPMIVEHVMAGRLSSIDIKDISDPALQRAIRSFISDKDALQVPDTVKRVEEYGKRSNQSCTWNGLLLLRGLLTFNILLFTLTERRWRVDYGLVSQSKYLRHSLTPIMLAVPYRAKDVPAPNTQFGHPDITIILTCLSYYYGGLTEEQLRTSFELLLDEDDPTIEYALWVQDFDDGSVSNSLRTLGEINLKSSEQWDKVVFPLFSRNQATIDFYLSRAVFPKEAKEYPFKLSASSWDLVEKQAKVITGFSGTNDGRWLLPMSVSQRDPDHERGTNARVLAYLLQPENNFYVAVDHSNGRPTTTEFLQLVASQRPEIRVVLDVGAQILDHSNDQVAKAWLAIARDAAGAIYFDKNDELMVLMRNGRSISMLSSSLSQQLDRCVVYVDHAHTRGTDIKLPTGSRAAVTLGPKLTKDSLVQGCMRMRKLGHGHSVVFFAPPEVDWSIRALTSKKDRNTQVTTVDILSWAIHETWTEIQQQAVYWAQQGMNHKSKSNAWSRFCNNDLAIEHLSDAWLQSELKSLEDLYAPSEAKNVSSTFLALDAGIRQHCKDLGILSLPGTQMEEEQEREVNCERERERELELPPKAIPVDHFLHPDVAEFVKTGIIPPLHSSDAFRPIFTTFEKSTAVTFEADVWSPLILATVDFCNTIKPESTQGTIDQYLRPVQWVLTSKKDCGQLLVLLSPFEVNCLMSDIRASEHVHLHVYAPRTSKRMKPSDDLKLYTIPPLPSDWTPPWALIDQLNVFAGQLYLTDYASYLRLCHFLGVPTRELQSNGAVQRNLYNIPGSFEENEITFSGSPLPSVMALLAVRNRGRPFAHTHMGKILHGQQLREKDFEGP